MTTLVWFDHDGIAVEDATLSAAAAAATLYDVPLPVAGRGAPDRADAPATSATVDTSDRRAS